MLKSSFSMMRLKQHFSSRNATPQQLTTRVIWDARDDDTRSGLRSSSRRYSGYLGTVITATANCLTASRFIVTGHLSVGGGTGALPTAHKRKISTRRHRKINARQKAKTLVGRRLRVCGCRDRPWMVQCPSDDSRRFRAAYPHYQP